MSNIEDQMERLRRIREKIDTINQTRARVSGELDSHMRRKNEIEKKFLETYGFDIKDAESETIRLEEEAEHNIKKAEELLK